MATIAIDSSTNNPVQVTAAYGTDSEGKTDTSKLTFKVDHQTISQSNTTDTVSNTTSIPAITSVTRDDYGHITGTKTTTYTIPTYSLDDTTLGIASNVATFTNTLRDSTDETDASTIKISSNTLALTKNSGDNTLQMNLTWGEF